MEIDGLRSLAVLPVILFYSDISVFSGSHVGGDVVPVISGYLIAMILLDQIAAGRFSIFVFHLHRARRTLSAPNPAAERPYDFVVFPLLLWLVWSLLHRLGVAGRAASEAAFNRRLASRNLPETQP
ncbi:hypothetical protein [Rhodovulum visakhapatnamense]|uniref:hypothetical protein n=1 Tax=Rhodovulum visakhapatnamense TaxID=364297 RepID=UPI00106520A7|nr:hypothetical protein [Rhodovulum visakhapatnamense]